MMPLCNWTINMLFNRKPKENDNELNKANRSFQSWIKLLSDREEIHIPKNILRKYISADISEKLNVILDFLETQGIEWVDENEEDKENEDPENEEDKEEEKMEYQAQELESKIRVLSEMLKEEINIPESFASMIGKITFLQAELKRLEGIQDKRNKYMD